MPFVAENGLTEAGTSRTIQLNGLNVRYHDIGAGEPVLFLNTFGPGSTAWLTFHKVIGTLSQHYRCILMDLPNYGGTGPIVITDHIHILTAQTAVALLDALGLEQAAWVGNSLGGHCALVAAIRFPERVTKFVMGGGHILAGNGNIDLMGNRPTEGARAAAEVNANPTPAQFRRYLRVFLNDETMVTDELVDYVHTTHTRSPEFMEARRKSVTTPTDYTPEMEKVTAPALVIHGRYDRMTHFEQSITLINHLEDARMILLNSCGHWPPFEKPREYAAHVLSFLKGY